MRRQDFLHRNTDTASVTGTAASPATPPVQRHTVQGWNRLALEAIRNARLAVQPAARALAILHTAMYNAWAAYDDAARQTVDGVAVRLPSSERGRAGRTVAMAHAAHLVLCSRFPAQRAAFDAHLVHLLRPLPRPREQTRGAGLLTPAGIGRVQAAGLLDACDRDGAVPPSAAAGTGTACEHWCAQARRMAERGAGGDDRDVLLFFVLANALDNAAIALGTSEGGTVRSLLPAHSPAAGPARWRDECDGAADEVLRRFAGEAQTSAGASWGRALGARVFEKARRCWEGKPCEAERPGPD